MIARSHHRRTRTPVTIAAPLTMAIALIACGSDTVPRAATPSPVSESATTAGSSPTSSTAEDSTLPLQLVVLGDSIAIPSMGCGACTGFDQRYRDHLEQATGRAVELHNEARPEAQILTLTALLDTDDSVRAEVAAADVVVVSIGYNDGPPWGSASPCHPPEAKVDTEFFTILRDFTDECIAATNETFRSQFDGVYARIEELAGGRPQLRIDLGNFNNLVGNPGGDGTLPQVWIDGEGAGVTADDIATATANMTTAIVGFNDVECAAATAHGFICADLYHAFNGPDGAEPLADFVNPDDYVHPNELGQATITELLKKVGLGPLDPAARSDGAG